MKIIALASILIMLSSGAYAEERTMHYEGKKIASSAQAVKVLNSKISDINKIVAKQKLSDQDLEKIHEITYSLETASDKLIEDHKNNSTVDNVGEAVQALHSSSENHNEKETRKWFKQLSQAVWKLKL
ncbi:MAG: DUF6746 family protein [Pseudomonadota bacterium]